MDRIAKIDQTILRIATYEILYVPMVPFNVSVSEAVFLSKKYSTDEARSFINGILGNLSYLRPPEPENGAKAADPAVKNSEAPAVLAQDAQAFDAEASRKEADE